jgi:hypothetical protein
MLEQGCGDQGSEAGAVVEVEGAQTLCEQIKKAMG